METTVTASFADPSAAKEGAAALTRTGAPEDQVLVFPAEAEEVVRALRMSSPNHQERAIVPPEVGGTLGFVLGFGGGGFAGLLLGSGVLNVMGREPAMAIGAFWSAALGALVLGLAGALAGYLFNAPLPALDPAPARPPRPRLTVVSAPVPADRAQEAAEAVAGAQPAQVAVWRRTPGGWVRA